MPKGSRRRSSDKYSIFESGDHIPRPDLAAFKDVCREAAQKLGMDWEDVFKIYKTYIEYSIKMTFPEDKPRELDDEVLLTPRRIMNIRGIASAEVTPSSLWGWRQIESRIKNKRNKTK